MEDSSQFTRVVRASEDNKAMSAKAFIARANVRKSALHRNLTTPEDAVQFLTAHAVTGQRKWADLESVCIRARLTSWTRRGTISAPEPLGRAIAMTREINQIR